MKKREFSFFDRTVLVVIVAFLGGTLAAFASWAEVTSRAVQCACMWTLTSVSGGFLLGRWMEIRDLARERKAFAQRNLLKIEACLSHFDREINGVFRQGGVDPRFVHWANTLDHILQEIIRWNS